MIKAIWRAAAPGRLGMFIAVLSIAVLGRLAGVINEGDRWSGSESQALYAVVVLGLLLPVFVAMLGTSLLRGEHAPWSWGLARPLSRFRLLGSVVALDALTIGACIFAAWLVLGGFGNTWSLVGGFMAEATAALVALVYATFYMLTAIAGSRTSSTVRATTVAAVALATMVFSLSALLTWMMRNPIPMGLHEGWAHSYFVYGALGWGRLDAAHTWWSLAGLLLATAAIGGPIVAFVRAAQAAPGIVRLPRLVAPSILLVGCVALPLLAIGWACAYADAPPEAKKGDVALHVRVRDAGPGFRIRDFRLRFDGGIVPRRQSHPVARTRGNENWEFENLSPGRYEACASVEDRESPEPGWSDSDHCVQVVLTDDPSQELSLVIGE